MQAFPELVRRTCNTVFYRFLGGDRRPVFFDVERTYPALRAIDANYDAIREELLALLPHRQAIPRYHEIDAAQQGISGADGRSWRVLFVSMHNADDELPNRELLPRTRAVVAGIPNVMQAFFSILEPRKSVPAHNGPYLGYLRYHTGFVVPERNPPSLRVKDQVYTWKERESVLFDDSWNHEVMNACDGERVVLIVDVLRPMPWPLTLLNRFARRVFFSRKALEPALAKLTPIDASPAPAGS